MIYSGKHESVLVVIGVIWELLEEVLYRDKGKLLILVATESFVSERNQTPKRLDRKPTRNFRKP